MEERWETIKSAPEYEVSNRGRVRYKKNKKVRKLRLMHNKYLAISLKNSEGLQQHFRVHRLVAIAFLGRPKGKKCIVDHINHKRDDNFLSNLRWVSSSENSFNRTTHQQYVREIIAAYKEGLSEEEIVLSILKIK